MPTLQNGELLAEGKILEDDAFIPASEADQRYKATEELSKHGQKLYQRCRGRTVTM